MVVALVLATLAVVTRDEPEPLEQARALLDRDEDFAAAETAGLTVLRVSSKLKEAGEQCAKNSAAAQSRRCNAYFAGAGHVQVISIQVVRCSRPEIFDVRTSLQAYLDELSSEPGTASLPALPRCA